MRSLLLLTALLAPLAAAQPVSPTDVDALFDAPPVVEINLRGSLLRLAAEATRESEPEAAAMLDGLRAVTVRVYPADSLARPAAVRALGQAAAQFEAADWFTFMRVRPQADDDDSGDVWVYVRESGDTFEGMALMAIDKGRGHGGLRPDRRDHQPGPDRRAQPPVRPRRPRRVRRR